MPNNDYALTSWGDRIHVPPLTFADYVRYIRPATNDPFGDYVADCRRDENYPEEINSFDALDDYHDELPADLDIKKLWEEWMQAARFLGKLWGFAVYESESDDSVRQEPDYNPYTHGYPEVLVWWFPQDEDAEWYIYPRNEKRDRLVVPGRIADIPLEDLTWTNPWSDKDARD